MTERTVDTHIKTLRALESGDIQPWFDDLSQPEVFEHTSWDVREAAELAPYVWRPSNFSASSMLRFAVALRDSGALIGTAGFHTVSPANASAEMVYDLAPSYWGKGIASAACAALLYVLMNLEKALLLVGSLLLFALLAAAMRATRDIDCYGLRG